MPALHLPAQARNQPAGQSPGLDDGVRAMFHDNFAQGLDGARGGGGIEGLRQNTSPIFKPAPVEIARDSPANSAGASFKLSQPSGRRGPDFEPLHPAHTI